MSKTEAPKVYDYLYSLDWGLCHGPIDSINQVWVKDKPIFCGGIRERMNVCIDLPDLFGGDLKEGGVFGVLEAYMGDNDQTASAELASREDLTPTTFPGYRGVSHLFFRGYSGNGFKWATNNYYLGDVKVNVTSIPRELGPEFSVIWPMGEENPPGIEDGSWLGSTIALDPIPMAVTVNPEWEVVTQRTGPRTFNSSTPMVHEGGYPRVADDVLDDSAWIYGPAGPAPVDLENCEALIEAQGYIPNPGSDESGEDVDLGGYLTVQLASITATLRARFDSSWPSLRTGQVILYIYTYAGAEDGDGNPLLGSRIMTTGSSFQRVVNVTVEGEVTGSVTVPSNCAYIRVFMGVNRTFPLWTSFTVLGSDIAAMGVPLAYQHCLVDGTLGLLPDANPAHMIYECMVNAEWGKGEDPALIDTASFEAAAETLFDERFGLSMAWRREDTVENFIQEVLDHIKAFLYQNPTTGLWTLKLLRDDYDASTLPWLTPDNCVVRSPKRRRWGETINQITVSYTDPANEKDATVTAHNIANMSIQGGTSAETRNYYGVRNANLAQTLANRDVIEAGTPLWSGVVEVDRSEWQITPGAVRRLEWPDESIENMVIRIMSVDYGKKGDRKIRLNVVEDIFAVAGTTFTTPQEPIWQDDRVPPTPIQYAQLTSIPMPELMRFGTDPDAEDAAGLVRTAMMAFSDDPRPLDVQVRVQPVSGDPWTLIGTMPPLGLTLTDDALIPESSSRFPRAWIDEIGSGYLQPGARLMLGDDDATGEIVRLDSFITADQEWAVRRGLYDTTPKAWAAGTRLWQYPDGLTFALAYETGEADLRLRVMPRTRAGRLQTSQAPTLILPAYERSILPNRPADVEINGQGFGDAIFLTGPYPDITVTWARRNRLLEDSGLPPAWTDADITPESGQTVHIVLTPAFEGVGETYTDLAGTSFVIPEVDIAAAGNAAYVDVYAKRDGLLSFQHSRRYVQLGDLVGWGYDWGNNWGG